MTEKVTSENALEFEVHKFMVDASDLGIPPGSRPKEMIETDLGNGHPFKLVAFKGHGYDKVAIYRQWFGCIELHVLPD